jgi:hypothetical protein
MATVLAIVVTLSCIALTIAFLGTLRTAAELRLRIAGAGDQSSGFRLDAGTGLPERLLASMPDLRAFGLLLFLSEDCSSCWQLVERLPLLGFGNGPVTVCVIGRDNGEMRRRLPSKTLVVEPSIARDAARHFNIDSTPTAVVHRDGYVVGSARGGGIERVQQLWSAATAPSDGHAVSSQPVNFGARGEATVSAGSDSRGGNLP